MNNSSDNSFNLTLTCRTPHVVASVHEFFICYGLLFKSNVLIFVLQINVIVWSAIFNILVIVCIYFYSISYSVFDQITIGHCLIQALTAILDVPFFHFMDVFGYWPLSETGSILWAIYDNNINTTTNLTVLYICWVRLRSVQQPIKFKDEILIKWPKVVMASIWAFGLGVWTTLCLIFGIYSNSTHLKYQPVYLGLVFNFLFWFLPLLAIFLVSVKIIAVLVTHSLRKKRLLSNNMIGTIRSYRVHHGGILNPIRQETITSLGRNKTIVLKPRLRFMLIIIVYWIQWIIPCVTVLVRGLCNCVPASVYGPIYWLTYTVVLTDPLTILALNSNIRFCWSSSRA